MSKGKLYKRMSDLADRMKEPSNVLLQKSSTTSDLTTVVIGSSRDELARMVKEARRSRNGTLSLDVAKTFLKDGKPRLAREWFRRAAKKGDVEGMFLVGRAYLRGIGGEKDLARADKWLIRAGEHKHGRALFTRAMWYRDLSSHRYRWLPLGWRPGKHTDLLRQAASAGDSRAMYTLGVALLDGTFGVEKSQRKGIHWLRKAAKANNASANAKLAGMVPGEAERTEFLERAASLGNASAKEALASKLRRENDADRALALYREAAEAGNSKAIFRLARMLCAQGEEDEAIVWYEVGTSRDDVLCIHNLAVILCRRGNKHRAATLYRAAAAKGHTASMVNLARLVRAGVGSCGPRPGTAVHYFERAAMNGSTEAMFSLGKMLTRGDGVVTADPVRALRWFHKGAMAGCFKCMHAYGVMLIDGEHVPANETEALPWLTLAAEGGHERSQKLLRSRKHKDCKEE